MEPSLFFWRGDCLHLSSKWRNCYLELSCAWCQLPPPPCDDIMTRWHNHDGDAPPCPGMSPPPKFPCWGEGMTWQPRSRVPLDACNCLPRDLCGHAIPSACRDKGHLAVSKKHNLAIIAPEKEAASYYRGGECPLLPPAWPNLPKPPKN